MPPAATDKPKSESSNIEKRRRQAQLSGDPEYRRRREELSQVAAEIFREKGFEGASINDFAKAIGIDRASIYYYISGKDELFQEIIHNAVKENIEMVEQIGASDSPTEMKIEKLIVELMKSYERHYPYLFVYIQEDMARIASKNTAWAREMSKLANRFDAAVLAMIEEGIDNGAIVGDRASAKTMAAAIVGMCNWSHRWFKPSQKKTAEAIGQQFSKIVLRGVLALPEA